MTVIFPVVVEAFAQLVGGHRAGGAGTEDEELFHDSVPFWVWASEVRDRVEFRHESTLCGEELGDEIADLGQRAAASNVAVRRHVEGLVDGGVDTAASDTDRSAMPATNAGGGGHSGGVTPPMSSMPTGSGPTHANVRAQWKPRWDGANRGDIWAVVRTIATR